MILVVMLPVLMAGSLTVAMVARRADNTRAELLNLELQLARSALLHYSLAYADLYGPGGAGPGHFPCPDTDAVGSPMRSSRRLEGPNPPCGAGHWAVGLLPRHVTVRSHRFAFHSLATMSLGYAVSTRYVNNPHNRVVNPHSMRSLDHPHRGPLLALIASRPFENSALDALEQSDNTNSRAHADPRLPPNSLAIYAADLVPMLARRVAVWLEESLNQQRRDLCASESLCNALVVEPPLDCPQGDSTTASDDSQAVLQHEEVVVGQVMSLWALLRQHRTDDTGCTAPDVVTLPEQLEGVPLARHWFIRNDWLSMSQLMVDPECQGLGWGLCEFTVGVQADALMVRLSPVHIPQ